MAFNYQAWPILMWLCYLKKALFRHESCLQGELHGPASEVQRGSRSRGLSFSFLTEKSGAGGTAARGQSPPLAPSDNELSHR